MKSRSHALSARSNGLCAQIRTLVLLLAPLACQSKPKAPALLLPVVDVPLPGDASRFDYASLDPAAHRLYLNHMGAGEVVVFDTAARKVETVLQGYPSCTGILAVPSRNELYVSVAGEGRVAVLDTRTLRELARVPAGRFPDGLAFDPENGRVFVSDERGGQVVVIETGTHRVVGQVPLGGEAGNTQYDPISRRIYTNVQTQNQLVAIDPNTLMVVARMDLPGAKGNHGLALDPDRRLAFVACEGNAVLLVVDLVRGRVAASFAVGRDPDVLAFDPGTGRLVVASESGPASVFSEEGGALRREGDQEVGPNAHVVAIDPGTHLLYFPLKRLGAGPGLRILAPAPR
ncbi:YncE family protein [Geothrix fermentans]|uniref:YncE family protein n=1 Tax=Geothrix fermentans TaxID=44676 RepID=UPI0003FD1BB7|nr:YncE family protein [Geothrix fermentans]